MLALVGKPLPSFDDLPPLTDPPILLLDNEETAKIVLSYAQKYTQLFNN